MGANEEEVVCGRRFFQIWGFFLIFIYLFIYFCIFFGYALFYKVFELVDVGVIVMLMGFGEIGFRVFFCFTEGFLFIFTLGGYVYEDVFVVWEIEVSLG